MSYILGALKKAEKERKRDQAPGFDHWNREEWAKPGGSGPGGKLVLYATLLALMLALIIFAWLAYKILILPNRTTSPAPEEVDRTEPARMGSVNPRSEEVVPVYADTELPVVVGRPGRTPGKVSVKEAPQGEPRATNRIASPKSTGINRSYAPPTFSGHIYFSNQNHLSRVFSGSESYREGDEVDGYLIERIGETQVLLSRGGKNVSVELVN